MRLMLEIAGRRLQIVGEGRRYLEGIARERAAAQKAEDEAAVAAAIEAAREAGAFAAAKAPERKEDLGAGRL